MGHTKLESNFGKVEKFDVHEETRVLKKNDTQTEDYETICEFIMLYDIIFND